ncbi:RmlC-like cupin [Setomelanomma holmii]|uniref:RmlC-like cupin n=1 Tax=Setomelanomma holmii TaxID=210430 RepID=A0A9P4H4H4_9PLEO|nr:RmlC-like cupin [Setomelanomma holmii]
MRPLYPYRTADDAIADGVPGTRSNKTMRNGDRNQSQSSLSATQNTQNDSLYVNVAPSYVRPYVIPHYASAQGVTIGPQYYRFYVTGPSSGYAFTVLGTSARKSSELGVLAHHHQQHFENFFNLKGRFQLFAEPKGSGEQQSRTLTQHDFGTVTRNTTHTFKILDPDTEIGGFIVPGGFEDLFLQALGGTNTTTENHTPYIPSVSSDAAAGPNASQLTALQSYDVYAGTDFVAAVNSTIYLNSQYGYQIVQPLVTPTQAQDMNYILSTITNGKQATNVTTPAWNLPGAAAFQVLEGQLSVQIEGYPTAQLITGDVVFVPGNVTYRYWSEVAFTKTAYISAGFEGIDQWLIKGGREWAYVIFPAA